MTAKGVVSIVKQVMRAHANSSALAAAVNEGTTADEIEYYADVLTDNSDTWYLKVGGAAVEKGPFSANLELRYGSESGLSRAGDVNATLVDAKVLCKP